MNILNKIIEQKKAEIKTLDYKASNDKSFNTKKFGECFVERTYIYHCRNKV